MAPLRHPIHILPDLMVPAMQAQPFAPDLFESLDERLERAVEDLVIATSQIGQGAWIACFYGRGAVVDSVVAGRDRSSVGVHSSLRCGDAVLERKRWPEMPESGLLVSWREIDPGRQERGLLRLFSEVLAYHDRLVEDGRISGFEPFVLGGGGVRGLRGFMIVRGTPEQITNVREDDEFLAFIQRAQRLMKDVSIEELYLGDALRQMIEPFEQQSGTPA